MKPLPMFEEFLNESFGKVMLGDGQLKGVKISDEVPFTGEKDTWGPVAEKSWLPSGEYVIGSYDTNRVTLNSGNGNYWIARYDFE